VEATDSAAKVGKGAGAQWLGGGVLHASVLQGKRAYAVCEGLATSRVRSIILLVLNVFILFSKHDEAKNRYKRMVFFFWFL
jgi:hypothetical protein